MTNIPQELTDTEQKHAMRSCVFALISNTLTVYTFFVYAIVFVKERQLPLLSNIQDLPIFNINPYLVNIIVLIISIAVLRINTKYRWISGLSVVLNTIMFIFGSSFFFLILLSTSHIV
ncbi:hypothetical protein [Desulfovibrio litoralis]|uniref:Uncharacterized protein n=1 Tax=Desulfovibrio litoralis DSM 11393 TaxID=1121455 RepID=A0A1M7TET9_9BACT|nr:hypothetical protein [Desulfovibrio litoralis]SHN69279.1 hypothetical protein SAMN02745728_01929 [Desulfovibrio litoralis DSM 11393]